MPNSSSRPEKIAIPRTIRLNENDNVMVCIDRADRGVKLTDAVTTGDRIPRGHKVALRDIATGQPVVKFGQTIGVASKPIVAGEWVHEHNTGMVASAGQVAPAGDQTAFTLVPESERETFMGYVRANGRVGTRNYIGILTSVNCSATVARHIAEEINRSGLLADYDNIDGVVAFNHGTGCGMDNKGEGFDILSRTHWGYGASPNLGGVLVVGLGCEVFQIARFKREFNVEEGPTFRTHTIQDMGGTRRAIAEGVKRIMEMAPVVNGTGRQQVPASKLVLALQCGGSDGYSGITANPALGVASDLLVRQGGTSILAETPEIYGAEHLLLSRAVSPEVAQKLRDRLAWWEDYTARSGGEMNNNPSPGNKAGGLTTILEKSLGAVAKAGHAPLQAVYEYAEQVTATGLTFMDTPGYDPVSATGQVAGGANILAFTTGRGSAYGCKPVPAIKLATSSQIYTHMQEDMDINCGDVLDGVSLETKGREIFETLLRVASGERTKSELLGYGDAEFVPWQVGAVM
ncbi:MAG: altronate dehydratase [Alphaproteobacteria bacterium]|nr:altronate dehydratase [Alphaproteobacteria bacterium]